MNSPSTLQASTLVALGGATGAVLRFHTGRLIGAATGPNSVFPWGTFSINVIGSLAMCMLAGWLARNGANEGWRLLIGVGVLGGFTTFSAFSLESALLIERGLIGPAALYAAGSVIAGIVGLFAGLAITRAVA